MRDQDRESARREVNAAMAAGDWERAMACADAALSAGADDLLFIKLRAALRDQRRELTGALEDYRQVLLAEPSNSTAGAAFALLLAKTGAPQEGLAALEPILRREPGLFRAWLNQGAIFQILGDLASAERALLSARATDPANLGAASNLAWVRFRLGRSELAARTANEILAADPDHLGAAALLARIDTAEGRFEAAIRRLRPALERSGSGDAEDRAMAYETLGQALDGLDRGADAFAAFAAANRHLQAVSEGLFNPGGPLERGSVTAERVLTLMRAEDGPRPPSLQATETTRSGHVFILGFPRSGTTLAAQILAAHPDVLVGDEVEALSRISGEFLSGAEGFRRLWTLSGVEAERLREAYWRIALPAGAKPPGVYVDKLPLNSIGLPVIRALFPDAKIIFMQRDPRDVVLSCFQQSFQINPGTVDLLSVDTAARFFDTVMRIAVSARPTFGALWRQQVYEDLVLDFQGQTNALFSFVGLEPPDRLSARTFFGSGPISATPSGLQLTEGLSDRGIGRWRRFEAELARVQSILEPWTTTFGYES